MLSFKIAFRYLRAKKSHRAVNIITMVAVVGVTIATMAMVLLLSIFNGFTDLAVSQLSTMDPDIAVIPAGGKTIADADSVANVLAQTPGVRHAYPVLSEKALLDDSRMRLPVSLKGVPSGYDRFSEIESIMIAGEYAESTSDGTLPAVQLSVGVANNITLRPSPDSEVRLFVPRRKGRVNPANPSAAFRSEYFAFSGVFRTNSPDVDEETILVPLDAARDLLDYDRNEASSIEISLEPGYTSDKVGRELKAALGSGYKVLDRLEQRADSFKMISVEKWITFLLLLCILVIALFNVVSTLSLLALEKRDNMLTLRALGASLSLVKRVFVAEGFLITVLGGAIGIVCGVALALAQQIFHFVKLSADASTVTIDYYPVSVRLSDVLVVAGAIIVLALIISFIGRLVASRR